MKGLEWASHSGLLGEKTHAWPDQFCPPTLESGWQQSCGDWAQWSEREWCVCTYVCAAILPSAIQSLKARVTFQEISTDVRLGPQLSRRSSGGGEGRFGRGEIREEREEKERWVLLIRLGKISQHYGLWGRASISCLSLPFFLCLWALLLLVAGWMIPTLLRYWQHETYLAEWHQLLFTGQPNMW